MPPQAKRQRPLVLGEKKIISAPLSSTTISIISTSGARSTSSSQLACNLCLRPVGTMAPADSKDKEIPPLAPAATMTMSSLEDALALALPFLRGEEEQVDPALPRLAAVLRAAGAGECWHKHGTFLSHLLDVYRILRLWRAPDAVARCGLYHSSYSNSYVNLAIFDPGTGRDHVAAVVGAQAERLVHLFCVVPRQQLIHDDLLFHYTDEELVADLKSSEASLQEARRGVFKFNDDEEPEPWRRKIQRLLPAGGVTVKHIRTGEDVKLSRRVAAAFLLMTMADFSDQLFDWQDRLFDNTDGRLEFRGNRWRSLWPGSGKPGLWVSSISRMGALYSLIVREEEIHQLFLHHSRSKSKALDDDVEIEPVIPPVFDGCTKVLDAGDQKAARDLYWEAICNGDDPEGEGREAEVEQLLKQSITKNPFVGEPHLVLAQVYLNMERYIEAEAQAEQGLKLLLAWGTSWDKRMSWEGWVSWGRAMLGKAKHKDWPHTSFGVLSLGLVE